jgi:hypothetical protein
MTDHKLPTFEGRVPDTAAVSFTGGAEGEPPHIEAYVHGQEVAFLVLGAIGDITHGDKGGEKDRHYVRSQKVVVDRVVPLDAEEAARAYAAAKERINADRPREGTLDDVLKTGGGMLLGDEAAE